ncbi:para-nitrobenzyl esterase [Sinomicrobium oceani]|uniref:Carboxylic ester hydrolase n=1 Tax=Sinomicrobium oceani TaxID=1150368 RepID=A0A1K1M595_9FLAO|nr:carboxylesterase family protein [Sinomicrobium oceani]SFW17126.1 para-nitrobenzyl esterase [Sinomicrobium oceani]
MGAQRMGETTPRLTKTAMTPMHPDQQQDHTPLFFTEIGSIKGWKDHHVIRATGIPYAIAKRYERPRETVLPEVPYPATQWSPACPQNPSGKSSALLGQDMMEGLKTDENCHHLSITMPDTPAPEGGWPVMVWIYGGSYTSGAGDAPIYDPALLVRENRVIVVNINYRLGILGFLGGYRDIPANLGLFDIIAALQWTKKHITAFGGDPENITLFGQSAGGDAIAHLMLAEGVDHLFRRVIIQSAPLGIRKGKTAMIRAMTRKAMTLPKTTGIRNILDMQTQLILSMKRFGLKGGMPFGIQYGQAPLPLEKDADTIWKERAGKWDVMIGWTDRETSLFVPFSPVLQSLPGIPLTGKAILEWLIKKTTDRIYRKPALALGRLLAAHNGNVYSYRISWGSDSNMVKAAHITDIALLFSTETSWERSAFGKEKTPGAIKEAGKKIRKIWTEFARTGTLEEKSEIPGLIAYRLVKYPGNQHNSLHQKNNTKA